MKYTIQIKAKNTPMGNPQRAWIVWDAHGVLLGVYNEGYAGRPKATDGAMQLASILVPKSEYHEWLKEGKEV